MDNTNYLEHYGVLGMKWGVRRARKAAEASARDAANLRKHGYTKEADAVQKVSDAQRRKANTIQRKLDSRKTVHEDYAKAHINKSVKEMSDSELRSRNNRLQMEQQYATLTKKKHTGAKVVKSLIATAGTIAAAEGAYKTYKGMANKAIDAIGDYVMSDLKKGLAKGF